jgi:hypothetical protein
MAESHRITDAKHTDHDERKKSLRGLFAKGHSEDLYAALPWNPSNPGLLSAMHITVLLLGL